MDQLELQRAEPHLMHGARSRGERVQVRANHCQRRNVAPQVVYLKGKL
jgi:hypothetical protein